jgi:hypothetical protein
MVASQDQEKVKTDQIAIEALLQETKVDEKPKEEIHDNPFAGFVSVSKSDFLMDKNSGSASNHSNEKNDQMMNSPDGVDAQNITAAFPMIYQTVTQEKQSDDGDDELDKDQAEVDPSIQDL